MRLPGINRKQNYLQIHFKANYTYVRPTNGMISTSRELTIDEMIARVV